MPKVYYSISGSRESVTRPVITQITNQLMEWTGISKKTNIFYPGDNERIAQTGVNITPSETPNITPHQERLSIEVDENTDQARMISEAVFRPEHFAVFSDEKIGVEIIPVYSSTEVAINFKYRAKDKSTAMRWRDEIRARTSMNREMFVHSIDYCYLIPDEEIIILKEIHRLRESVAGYNQDWDSYFKEYSSDKLTVLNNLSGTQGAYAIAEPQGRAEGWFDFEGEPEKGSRENEGDSWVISFTYKLFYSKPIGCVLTYPILIHNQLLSEKYRPTEPYPSSAKTQGYYSLSGSAFSMFDATNRTLGISSGVSIPGIDEFIPSSIKPNTVRVFTALCSIDTSVGADTRLLLNLNELGESTVDPEIIPFLSNEAPYLNHPYMSVFTVCVYEGVFMLNPDQYSVSSSLDVKLNFEPDLRKTYRVRLGLSTNFKYIKQSRVTAIQDYPKALSLVLNALGCEFDESKVIKGFFVPNEYFSELINKLDWLDGNIRKNNHVGLNTVQVLSIKTERRVY